MRLVPPKTRKKIFKGKKEVRDFLFGHKVICGENRLSVLNIFEKIREELESDEEALEMIVSMYPWPYQDYASEFFAEHLTKAE